MFVFTYTAALLSVVLLSFAAVLVIKKKKSLLVWLLVFHIISDVIWVASNAAADISKTPSTLIFWSGMAFVGASFLVSFFLLFVDYFISEVKPSFTKVFLFCAPSIVFSALAFSDFSVIDTFFPANAPAQIVPGIGYTIYPFFLFGGILYALTRLFFTYRHSDLEKQKQIAYIATGFIFLAIGMATFSLILPLLGELRFFTVGPQFTLFFIIFASYAVFRHNLFHLKVITTELLTIVIWLFVFVRTFFSVSQQDLFINITLLFGLLVFGVMLIKSVNKEVQSREQVQLLAKNLEKTNARLQELDKLKSEFLSLATHQMRSPLSAIKGYASLLLEGSYGKLDSEVSTVIERVLTSAESMISVVGTFLDVSRIEQGRMVYHFEESDIAELVRSVIDQESILIEKAGLHMITQIDDAVVYVAKIDIEQMRQVMRNIIDNAISYTETGSITIGLKRENNTIKFYVTDTGIGMTEKDKTRLFQRFSRADNAHKTNVNGTGLGLYLAKKITDAHGGTITANSPGKGQGSTFTITLNAV